MHVVLQIYMFLDGIHVSKLDIYSRGCALFILRCWLIYIHVLAYYIIYIQLLDYLYPGVVLL